MKPPRPIRLRLFQLAASGLLPLVLVALFAVAWLADSKRDEAQRAALEVSRALASAVDAELRATLGVLGALGESNALRAGDLDAFRGLGERVARQRGWRTVILADGAGRIVMSTSQPAGAGEARPVEPASMQRAIETRAPAVGVLASGGRNLGPAFAVRLPLLEGGNVKYVLSAVVPTDSLLALLKRQNVPATWVVAIFDQSGQRVARTQDNVVRRPSPSLQALLATGAAEGAGPTVTLEGVHAYTGFVRLPVWDWAVAIGIARSEVLAELLPLVGGLVAGVLLALALAAGLAHLAARRVEAPIEALRAAAVAIGEGKPPRIAPLGIAELDALAHALSEAAAQRDKARREAEESARSKDEFLAVLGHELRNPLAPIANAMHLMALKNDPNTVVERRIVERQLGHMKRLVDDLLDVSRITGKRLAMQMAPLQPATLATQAVEAVRPLLHQRTLELAIEPAAAAAWVRGDEVRLAQVLNNLLGNAVKFTAPGGRVALALRLRDGGVELTVRDDGQGMASEVVAHAFDLFYQAPQEADRARGGLGLGLAIVRSLVEMHGGTVEAASDGPGRGSRFTLWLPQADAPPDAVAASDAPAGGGRGRVLLVDDNEDAAETAAALLGLAGYEVRVLYEPQAAAAEVERFAPAVAVLDIGLPGMSGYELARRLRAAGYTGRLVAMTGYGRESDVSAAHEAGFDMHLTKPVTADELLAAVAPPA